MSSLTKDNHLTFFTGLTAEHGAVSLRKKWLLEKGYSSEYHKICNLGIKFDDIADKLHLTKEFKEARGRNGAILWTDQKIDEVASELIGTHGCIPIQPWLQQNGYGGFCHAAQYYKGGLDKLRENYYSTTFTKPMSRDGQRWDSWSESNVANFFWARGIQIFQGSYYPDSYSLESGRKYGKYDLEFDGLLGDFSGKRIFLEVWGDLFGQKASARYAETREHKEKFHANNNCFVGLHYEDTYKDGKLAEIFEPFIGQKPVIKYKLEHDRIFAPAQWSLSDEVLKISKKVCENMPDKQLPSSSWFNRDGEHNTRPVNDWELKSWRGFIRNVQIVGGFNKIRLVLDQKVLAECWTKDKVLVDYLACFKTYKKWPLQVMYHLKKKKEKTAEDITLSKQMQNLDSACRRFFDSTEKAVEAASNLIPGYEKKRGDLPRGVSRQKNNRYYCQIQVNCVNQKLGTYDTIQEAEEIYIKAKTLVTKGASLERILQEIRSS